VEGIKSEFSDKREISKKRLSNFFANSMLVSEAPRCGIKGVVYGFDRNLHFLESPYHNFSTKPVTIVWSCGVARPA